MSLPIPTVEGEIDFHVPAAGKPCKTFYKVFGNLTTRTRTPVVLLHGGPGAGHEYMLSLGDIAGKYSIPVIIYDQLGNGLSTHLPEKNGDATFWTEQLFLDELDNLLRQLNIQDDYNLLGHSWGGMLGSLHAIRQPKGLKHLVLASSPASMSLWEESQSVLRKQMPQDVQDILHKHEAAGTTNSEEYAKNVKSCYHLFVCRLDPWPQELIDGLSWLEKDPTVYGTMNGPSEVFIVGSLKGWSIVDQLHKIDVPTLLINGRYDEAQDLTMLPFFRKVPRVKWFTFAESSHTPHLEEKEKYHSLVADFLSS